MAFVPYFLHSANQTTRNARVRVRFHLNWSRNRCSKSFYLAQSAPCSAPLSLAALQAASEYLWPDGSGDLYDSQGNYYFSNGDNDYIGPDGTYYWSDDDGETLYGPDGAMFWSDGDGGFIQY